MKGDKNIYLRCLTTFLVGSLAVSAAAAPIPAKPELSGTWELSCLDGYKNIVSAMDPRFVPDKMAADFAPANKDDALAEKLYAKKQRLFHKGAPTVPWLTIYNKDLKPIYHAIGYNSRSDKLWDLVMTENAPIEAAPALYEIEPYTGVRAVDLPDADFTFVEYEADWCTNCKLQQAALTDYRAAHPEITITHVQIDADTAKMQRKKYKKQTCSVTTESTARRVNRNAKQIDIAKD